MSSGKLRRERSGSRERQSHKEGDKRSDAGVPELKEEEYDEQWEHEWDDINEISKSGAKYYKPYGKNPNQKWRGRNQFHHYNQYRGQNRFNKWEHRNYSAGSDHGSDSNRRTERRHIPDEEENLEMPPGEEITNLKVKIQDGKRFAAPDEVEMESYEDNRNRPRFSRGRGSRGYHGGGRDKWAQGNRFKRPAASDLVDCREVLNRRKRFHADSEGDLREKLQKKDSDLGDLREVIDSRDPGAMDLRDLIEAPDMSLMDEFTEDVVGEVDLEEDIRLRIRNDYYHDGAEDERSVRHFENDFESDAEPYEYEDDREPLDIPPEENVFRNEGLPHQEEWIQGKWRQRRGSPPEKSFEQREGWSGRNRQDSFPEADWSRSRVPHGSPREERLNSRDRSPRLGGSPHRRNRDHSRNRSRERVRSSPGRVLRERSFEQGIRPRDSSWEKRFELIPHRDRVPPEQERRGSFEDDRRVSERNRDFTFERERSFPPNHSPLLETERLPPMLDARGRVRSPPRETSRVRERNHPRMRSISPVPPHAIISERNRRSEERNNSVTSERGRVTGRDRNRSADREPNRGRMRERDSSTGQGRNWNAGQEKDRSMERVRTRSVSRERNRSFDRDRQRNFDQVRNRKRAGVEEGTRNSRWARSSSREMASRPGREINLGRDRDRSPRWTGPRTPSAERFRAAVWNQPKSPGRNRELSPNSEHSRGRGRQSGMPADQSRDRSRGRETEGRPREQKDKIPSRSKDQDRRDKVQDQPRRRDFEHLKTQDIQPDRPRESSSSSKPEQNRKREHEENSSKSSRDRLRSQEHRNLQEKCGKRTTQFPVEEFKQRFVREIEKPEKSVRRDEFVGKHGRSDSVQAKKQGSGFNDNDSREWENIRDFQERRTAQPLIDLPFLDEARRQRQNSSREETRPQESRSSRNMAAPFLPRNQNENRLSQSQKKDEAGNWQSQNAKHSLSHPEEERRRSSRWGSPGRREKASNHFDSHKSTAHSSQSSANPHHPPSNGKAEDGHWQRSRDLPSHGESQWNKPRSDLSSKPRDSTTFRPFPPKSLLSPREVIFIRGLARDVSDMDVRKDISNCGLWAKDVRVVYDTDTGVSRGLAFVTFNSVDEATRWMDLRNGVLNLRPNNHAAMDYSNPVSKDWECVRCHTTNFKNRSACYQCNRSKDDCLDGWEETCPYPTNALLLRGLNPLTSTSEVMKALKGRMQAHSRIDSVKMGVDMKGRPRSVCFVQLTSVVDSMCLHKSIVTEPLMIDNNLVMVAYCQLDKLPPMDSHPGQLHPGLPTVHSVAPPSIPLSLHTGPPSSNNIPVVPRTVPPAAPPAPVHMPAPTPAPPAKPAPISTTAIRSMLEGNYSEKDIPTLAQYCASAYAKNPQEQAAYVRYYTKLYREKLLKNQAGGK